MTETFFFWALICIALILLAGFLIRRRQQGPAKEKELERTLLSMVSGRRDVAQRLIQLEQDKNPDQPRAWHLQRAIDSLKRDRR